MKMATAIAITGLAGLKLITATRDNAISDTQHRRNKLSKKLVEQIELAKCQVEGRTYTQTKTKTVKNAEGIRVNVDVAKTVRAWWWQLENGKLALSVRYGSRVIQLNAKTNAVECANYADVINVLTTIKTAVEAGELDEQILKASVKLREGFKSTATK